MLIELITRKKHRSFEILKEELTGMLNGFIQILTELNKLNSIEGNNQYQRLFGQISNFNKKYYPDLNLTPIPMVAGFSFNRRIQACNEENRYHQNILIIRQTLEKEIDYITEYGLPDHLKKGIKTRLVVSEIGMLNKFKTTISKISNKILIPLFVAVTAMVIYTLFGELIVSYLKSIS